MDFEHTEERRMLADTLTRWILNDYPLAQRLDAGQSETGFSPQKWEALCDLGVLGALLDENSGGFGGAGFDLMVVFQALGSGLVVEPVRQSAVLAGGALAAAGGHGEFLEKVISGTVIATLAHDEGGGGYDPGRASCRATPERGGWVLNGAKAVVRAAGAADVLVVSATVDGGLSLFLVDPAARGVALRDTPLIDGGRAAEVTFEDVRLGPEALLGAPGSGGEVLTQVLGRGLLCLCAEALGLMETIRDLTLEYLRTRKQFGVPIGAFQALQHRMATLLVEIEQARSAVINAAAAVDTAGVARERALSAAKYTIGATGRLVAEESIQMHGGMGMTWEYPLGHFCKRLVMIDHELGGEDDHLRRFIELGGTA